MPVIPLLYNQHRQATGNHSNWLGREYSGQQTQHLLVKKMAMQPGRNNNNINRQNTAHAAIQLLSILSSVQNSTIAHSVSFRKEDEPVVKNNDIDFLKNHRVKRNANQLPIANCQLLICHL
ncbi:hypothetical protein [Pectobacterium brasiliense]|uniref:hypothetical protein n=1 Tax=Pectobacterium brasiliense TaxID=180957 RepID=UPI0019694891|nr:hypothetical protein [Pectobacterium brasiliense]MBN3264160.1 hypothetical protein [Pectobacterium brasiliense]